MASYVGQVKIGNTVYPVGSMLYGTCTTEAATAAKVVTMAAFDSLSDGITIHVKFTYSNTAASPTLKVGSTSAKPIMRYGTTAVSTTTATSWQAGAIVAFTYDGTNWVQNTSYDDNTTYQFDGTYNASTNKAATVSTVTNAIADLDVTAIAGSASKTLTSISETNGKISASYSDISITKSQVSDLGTIAAAAAKGVDSEITEGTSSTNLPTSAAVAAYIEGRTASITGAMHFIGTATVAITDGSTSDPHISGYDFSKAQRGDVILYGQQEYVWTSAMWELLGDEGSYALKSSTTSIGSASGWDAGTTPSLSKTDVSIPNVTSVGTVPTLEKTDVSIPNVTSVGSATTASVSEGILTISNGTAPQLGTAISASHVDTWSAGSTPSLGSAISASKINSFSEGTAPTLSVTSKTVVVP